VTSLGLLSSLELRLAPSEGNVSVPDHVLNLTLHGDAEKRDEVHDEDRPENRNIEQLKEGTREGDSGGLRGRIPEFELWQTPDEGSELLVLICRQPWLPIIIIQLHGGWVDFRSKEGEEKIKVIDCQCIGHDVPTLSYHNSGHKADDEEDGGDPPTRCVGRPSV